MKSECALFSQAKTIIVCETNFDHHFFLFPDLLSVEGEYFTDGNFPCYSSFFVYTFCRLLRFSQKLQMTFQDFHNIRSSHNITAELLKYGLFGKLSIETSANAHGLRLCYS